MSLKPSLGYWGLLGGLLGLIEGIFGSSGLEGSPIERPLSTHPDLPNTLT